MRDALYRRSDAQAYVRKWAFRRNPAYYNFDRIGGDCTNFASQCIFAGSGIMNTTPVTGWFYRSTNDRTASWTGVEYLYRFLTENRGAGPYGEEVSLDALELGDIVQFGHATGDWYHSPVVCGFRDNGEPLLAAHTFDAYDRPLSGYAYDRVRGIHILGVRRPD